MKLCVIPARGGSKRIPRKNVKDFCGKPMVAWSIEAATASGCFDKILVSTDDVEIADVAKNFGAEVPFMRPAELSDDFVGTTPVMRHAIEWVQAHMNDVEYACCVYATAPLISPHDLKKGLDLIRLKDVDYVLSATSYAFPIQRAIRISGDGKISMFSPEHLHTRSQDLEDAWHDAGQFYWGTSEAWCGEMPIYSERSAPVVLPRHRVQDIDTSEDWITAELLFRMSSVKRDV